MLRPRATRGPRKIWLALAACTFLATLTAPSLAYASEVPSAPVATLSLHLGSFEVDARQVSIVVGDIPAGTAVVVVRLDAAEATRVDVPEGESAVHVPLSIAGETAAVGAEGLDAAGAAIAATSHDVIIDTNRFIPAYPRVSVLWDAFIVPSQSIRVSTSRATSVSAIVGGRPLRVTGSSGGTSFKLTAPTSLPYGHTRLRVYVTNAWGVRYLSVPIWSLRWKPTTAHAVLVDKFDFTLYYAEGYRMHKVYPVAIGMPGTPTRIGQFWLGSPRPAGGPWGVLRMALSKRKGTGALSAWGGYYIHGTNQPDSIGTEASHGCVRMYNSGVRDLSRHTRGRVTRVTIRP